MSAPHPASIVHHPPRPRKGRRAFRGFPAVLRAGLLVAVAALVSAACASGGAAAGEAAAEPVDDARTAPADTGRAEPGQAEDARSTADLEAIYRARTDSARSRYTDADVHFMNGMIVHHAQALVMAALAPTHGASSRIRTLAARIANSQRDEIATMQRWLDERGLPVPEVEIEGTEMTVHGLEGRASEEADGREDHAGGHALHMPGMLTEEQLRELDAARGTEFDRLFLSYMIQHHQGAVEMVHDLFATDGAAQNEPTFRLASDIQVDQLTEIARMEGMLERLPATGGGS